ncbi:MAG: hypothetical protein RIC06_07405 [Cyclobacteriaceae bacterium]
MIPNLKKSVQSLLVGAILLCGASVKAQDFGEILAAGTEDANTYLQNYMAPALNSFGNGLANGWYNTAKAHKTIGVDITLSFNMAQIPVSERTFQFIANDYNMRLEGDNDGIVPTMVGGEAEPNSELVIDASSTVNIGGQPFTFQEDIRLGVPSGIDLEEVPVVTGLPTPTLNLGIGIYKNTDLKIRLLPEINVDDFSIKMFGIGIMHDVKQWIPGIKNLPFDLSGFFGTSKITATYDITLDEQVGSQSTFSGEGIGEFVASATTIQALISKKLTVFTPYAGIGVNIVNSSIKVLGDYEYTYDPTVGTPQTAQIKDPIDLEFTGSGGPRFTIGGRLKLAVFTFHFDYTAQKYSTITGGVGIAVR